MGMAIHAVSGGNPTAQATYSLTGTSPTTGGDVTYTCSGSCSLNASTTYYLVLSGTASSQLNYYEVRLTDSDNETNTPSGSGWSLANGTKRKEGIAFWLDYDSGTTYDYDVIKFKLTARAK